MLLQRDRDTVTHPEGRQTVNQPKTAANVQTHLHTQGQVLCINRVNFGNQVLVSMYVKCCIVC